MLSFGRTGKRNKGRQRTRANLVMPARPVITATVLGKRKTQQEYVLRLTSSPEPTTYDSDCAASKSSPGSQPILVNGVLVEKTKKRYKCTFSGCDRAYAKPSRLAEHERTHTGEARQMQFFLKKSPEQLLTATVRL